MEIFEYYPGLFPELKAIIRGYAKTTSLSNQVALAMTCREEYKAGAVILSEVWRTMWDACKKKKDVGRVDTVTWLGFSHAFRSAFLFTRDFPECSYASSEYIEWPHRRLIRLGWQWYHEPCDLSIQLTYTIVECCWEVRVDDGTGQPEVVIAGDRFALENASSPLSVAWLTAMRVYQDCLFNKT
jgi:hypothetical protein